MSRIDVTQSDVFTAVVLRLRTALSLTEAQCYEVASADQAPILPTGGDYILTVAPGTGEFADEEQADGNVTEDTEVIISGYTRLRTDRTNSDKFLLLDESRGLLAIKKLILKSLVGQDLTNAAGNTFLRQVCHARRSEAPQTVERGREGTLYGCVRVTFGAPFDWNLT